MLKVGCKYTIFFMLHKPKFKIYFIQKERRKNRNSRCFRHLITLANLQEIRIFATKKISTMNPRTITLLILLTVCYQSVLKAQNKTTLAYNLTVGDTITVAQTAVQEIKQDLEGVVNTMTNRIEGVYKLKVLSATDEQIVLESSFHSLKFETVSDQYGILFEVDTDTAPEGDPMMYQIFQGLLHTPLTLTLRKDGYIQKLEGTEELISSMIANMNLEDEFSEAMIKKMVEKDFGNESLQESMTQMFYIFPVEKVAVGDTWENSYTGELSANNTWTLSSLSNDTAELTANSDIVAKTDDDSVTMEMTGTQTTAATITLENGFFEEMVTQQSMSGTAVMKQMNAIEIPTTIEGTITFKKL